MFSIRSFALIRILAAVLIVVSVGVVSSSVEAASGNWTGGAGGAGTTLDTATNWSSGTIPGSGETGTFNGTAGGSLALSWSTVMGGANGLFFKLTSGQIGSVTLNNADNGVDTDFIRLQDITIDGGAGAFTAGAGDGKNDVLALGNAAIDNFTWTNNSANTATIGNDVLIAYGAGDHDNELTLTGSGNWNWGGKFANGGTGSMRALIKSGAGTLTITSDTTGVNSTAQAIGSGRVFVKQGTMVIGTNGVVQALPISTNIVSSSIGQDGSDIGTLTLQGTGTFISGNTAGTQGGDFSVGDVGSSQGTVNISGSAVLTVNSGGGFFVGSANAAGSTASGIVQQSGGTVTVNRAVDGSFIIGGRNSAGTGTGTYNLSGGTVTNAGNLWLGGSGSGTVNQTGGTWNNTGFLSIGNSAGASGAYNLNAGTLTTTFVKSLGGTSTFNFNGGTLKANASSASFISALTRVNVRNGGAKIDTNSSNLTIAQPLLHSNIGGDAAIDGGLTVSGFGNVILTGANTYTGPTNVNDGSLTFNTAQSNIGAVNVADGATLSVKHTTGSASTVTSTSFTLGSGGASNLSFDFNSLTNPTAALISTGAFTANGSIGVDLANAALLQSGTYKLVSYSSYSGSATFPSGTYTFTPRTSGTIVNNGTNALNLNVTADKPVWTGKDAGGEWKVGTTGANSNWRLQSAPLTPTNYIEGDSVVFDETATGTTTVDISVGDVAPASVTFNNSTKTYTISSSSGFGITGSAGLIKNNGGTTNLNTPGSYSGGTTLNAGTLNLNASNAVGSGTTTVAGGTLGINNATGLGTGAITITGGALNNTSGSPLMLVNGNVQSWNGDFAFTGSNDLDMGTGAVTLGGSGSRTVTVNAGTLTVGAISSPTQGLTKAGPGKLAINPTSPLANSAIAGPLNVAAGTLQINTGSSAFDTMDFLANGLAGSGTIQNGGGVERSLVVNVDGNNTFSGKLEDGGAGALGLNKFGAGTLTLTGTTSTYTGTTTLTQGTLVAATPTALGSTSRVNAAANSTGTFRYATDGLDSVVPIGISSGSTVLNVVSDRATPGAAVDRTMTVPTGNGLGGGTVNFTAGPNVLSGTPKITFTQLGMGAGGGSQTTILNPTGVNLSLGDVSKFNSATAQTLALGGTSTGNEVTGVISNGSATVNISKTGSGTWKLLNANTFTGETSLTDGTLIATNTSALGGTSRLNITGTTGAGPTYIIATDGGDATLPIGINTGFTGTIATGRATAGPAVDRLMTVPTSSGLGNGTINFTVGPNVTSGIPRITFAQLGLGAGSGGTTTLNPVGVNLTLGDTSKFNNAPNQTLNLDGASTGNEITGVISNGTAIVSLSKSGASTWALTNTNSYTGTTTVNGGTLLVNGDNSGATGAVTVASGGVLGGTGKIGGDILMQAASTFATQFSGGTIDALDVGKLDLSALNNLLTVAGSGTSGPWTIINYSGTLTGTFESVTPGYTVNYGTGSNSAITISAAAGLLGDFNSDGKVDAGDYVTWRKNQNTNNALPNDNGLGTPVGTAHYNLWRANFGKPPGSGTGLAGASVPEPATWILVAMSAVMLSLVVRRRANTRLVLVPIGCPQSR